jgi:hypothetical protein
MNTREAFSIVVRREKKEKKKEKRKDIDVKLEINKSQALSTDLLSMRFERHPGSHYLTVKRLLTCHPNNGDATHILTHVVHTLDISF